MTQAEKYLESKTVENPRFVKVVSLEHAKIACKIAELEEQIQWCRGQDRIDLKSEIENLNEIIIYGR